jgi:hypothetical protein
MPRGQYGSQTLLIGREPYGTPLIGAVPDHSSSALPWIVGAVAVGAVLWARHENQKLSKLYAAHGVTPPTFSEDVGALAAGLGSDVKRLAHRAKETASGLARGWRSKREG